MKKIIIVKLVIILILVISCNILYINYFNMKKNNEELRFKIQKTDINIEKTNTDIDISKAIVEKLKAEKADSVWELDSWKLMKEKIENAL